MSFGQDPVNSTFRDNLSSNKLKCIYEQKNNIVSLRV